MVIDPLPEKQREFLAVMGLADEFTVEMAQFVMADAHAEDLLAALTGQNAFVKRLPDGATYRFHHMMKECALPHLPVHAEGSGRPSTAGGSASGMRIIGCICMP